MKTLLAALALCAMGLPVQAETGSLVRFSYVGTSEHVDQAPLGADFQPIFSDEGFSTTAAYGLNGNEIAVAVPSSDHLLKGSGLSLGSLMLAGDGQGKVVIMANGAAQDDWPHRPGPNSGLNAGFIHLAGDGQGKVVKPFMQLAKWSPGPDYAVASGSQWVAFERLSVQGW